MNKLNNFFILLVVLGIGGLLLYLWRNWDDKMHVQQQQPQETMAFAQPNTSEPTAKRLAVQPVDMRVAATESVKAVVHVKTQMTERTSYRNPFLEFFYGHRAEAPTRQVRGAGSGVIISSDGYIVTNNHVIERSDRIVVALNDQREFPAKLVGVDKNTDLALLKVEAEGLDTIRFANSDEVSLGEWVLAVGNPYNLTSTVTAGIVSAKGRAISDPRRRRMSLDAFIQTDAAVNPGNSGGALVNTAGELVGINTAIQSTTGSYVGYSFAIPSNVVAKVADDLKQYGSVQRGYLGVQIAPVTDAMAKHFNLDKVEGVYVVSITAGGAAESAGVQAEDIIIALNDKKINTVQELQEQLAKYSPGDNLKVSVKRQGILKHFDLKLRNNIGGEAVIQKTKVLGAVLQPLSLQQRKRLNLQNGGVIVTELERGVLQDAGVQEGFIILNINNKGVETAVDIEKALEDNILNGKFFIEGIYPNGQKAYYRFFTE